MSGTEKKSDDFDKDASAALLAACEEGNLDAVREALKNPRVDINFMDPDLESEVVCLVSYGSNQLRAFDAETGKPLGDVIDEPDKEMHRIQGFDFTSNHDLHVVGDGALNVYRGPAMSKPAVDPSPYLDNNDEDTYEKLRYEDPTALVAWKDRVYVAFSSEISEFESDGTFVRVLRKIVDTADMCISPDGTLFAAGKRGRVSEINLETGKVVKVITAPSKDQLTDIEFDAENDRFFVATQGDGKDDGAMIFEGKFSTRTFNKKGYSFSSMEFGGMSYFKGDLYISEVLNGNVVKVSTSDFSKHSVFITEEDVDGPNFVGFYPKSTLQDQLTPLMQAVEGEHNKVVALLLSHDPRPDVSLANPAGKTAISIAEDNDSTGLYDILHAVGHPLIFAAMVGDEERVASLLKGKSVEDINARVEGSFGRRFNAVHAAIMQGHVGVLDKLLDAGASLTIPFEQPGDDSESKEQLECLILAVQFGHPEIVQRLARIPEIDVNAKASDETTALHCAANQGSTLYETLHGGDDEDDDEDDDDDDDEDDEDEDEDEEDEDEGDEEDDEEDDEDGDDAGDDEESGKKGGKARGKRSGKDDDDEGKAYEKIVSTLLNCGADPNARDKNGCTPLHYAILMATHHTVEMICEAGVDVNAPDMDGNTPMMYAVEEEDVETIVLLIQSHADLTKADRNGTQSVLDVAVKYVNDDEDERILEALRKNFIFQQAKFTLWKELKNVKELSSGNFGITYRGDLIIAKTYKADVTVPVVLKVSKAETGSDEWHELRTLQNLPANPHVVPLLGVCTNFSFDLTKDSDTAMIIPFKAGGSLRSHLSNRTTRMSYARMVQFGLQMARGVLHLHENGYKHNDIAARNFLLSEPEGEEGSDGPQCLVLTDFGLTRSAKHKEAKPIVIPWRWVAPETLASSGRVSSLRSDIYMLGVTFWELLGVKAPPAFHVRTPDEMLKLHKENKAPLLFPAWTPKAWRELILECCAPDQSKRPRVELLVERLTALLAEVHRSDELKAQAEAKEAEAEEAAEPDSSDEADGADYADTSSFDDEYAAVEDLAGDDYDNASQYVEYSAGSDVIEDDASADTKDAAEAKTAGASKSQDEVEKKVDTLTARLQAEIKKREALERQVAELTKRFDAFVKKGRA